MATIDDQLRLLVAMLPAPDEPPLTLTELVGAGIRSPAQRIYELELAGYSIERVHAADPDGKRHVVGYRLAARPPRPRRRRSWLARLQPRRWAAS
jgi:hypothetical protein